MLARTEMRRRPGRFLLLAGAVALLVLLLLFFQAVAGTLTAELTGALARQDGEVIVYADSARRNPQASVLDTAVVRRVAEVAGVQAAAGVSWVPFTVGGADSVLVAIEPDGPGVPRLAEGRLPRADDEVVVSASSLADGDAAEVAVGDAVRLDDFDRELTVVGLGDGAVVNALPTFYLPVATVRDAVAARAGVEITPSLSFVAVTTDGDPAQVAARIADEVPGVDAVDRDTAVAALPGIGTISRSFGILYVLLYLVVAIVTAVFFLILTVQKRDALLLLRAVGARRRDVVVPTLVQIVVVVGGAAVLGAGAALALLTVSRDTFGAALRLPTVAATTAAMLVIGVAAGALSVRRILAIEPIEAVRNPGLG